MTAARMKRWEKWAIWRTEVSQKDGMKFKASSNIFAEKKRPNPINAHVISSKVYFFYIPQLH